MSKLLKVKWNEHERCTYYVDKNEYSKAHELKNCFVLNTYGGKYVFNKDSKLVTLDTGLRCFRVDIDWEVVEDD